MEKVMTMKHTILAAAAMAGSVISDAFGGWDGFLKLLICMMICDYICGILVAALFGRSNKSATGALDSRAGFRGLVKKCMILMLVWLGAQMDAALELGYARTAVCLFFIGNEGLSLLENIGLMGVPYPAFLKSALEALHERGDAGAQEETQEGEEDEPS